ncbi:hypothetical protein AURDEDRAFT_117646, partial [Auricularia subglabra TFB-10046 SS5]
MFTTDGAGSFIVGELHNTEDRSFVADRCLPIRPVPRLTACYDHGTGRALPPPPPWTLTPGRAP